MEVVTTCYEGDQIRRYEEKFNPSNSINFSETMYKTLLTTTDRIECVSRYVWENLPNAFDTQDIETLLYSNGSICCFNENDNILFSPFSLDGQLDKKGELYNIQPLTLDGKKSYFNKRRCYNPNGEFEFNEDACIIIQDYTGCIQDKTIVSRETLNSNTTISDETKTYKILLYNIYLSIKKMLVGCENEEQAKTVIKQAQLLLDPTQPILALSGNNFMEKLQISQFVDKLNIDELLRGIDFYNKTRRINNGIPSPDTFEKKERMITSEIENATTHSNLIIWDGYMNRKKACNYINKCFNLSINVKINPIMCGGDVYV